PAFSLLLGHFQALPTPQPTHPRVAGAPRFVAQQLADPPIAEPRPTTRELTHPGSQLWLAVSWLGLVTLAHPRLVQRLARPSLGHRERRSKLADRGRLPGRAHQFPSAMCLSIWLSSAR